MESGGMIDGFARVVFKISATLLAMSAILLLWLHAEGVGRALLWVVIGINALTALGSAIVIRIVAKRDVVVEKPAIIDVLERAADTKRQKGEGDEA